MALDQSMKSLSLYERIYTIVDLIPAGKVATYGQIAEVAGCSARQVGYAMATLPLNAPIPWQRVINSQGKISMRGRGTGDRTQRKLLEEEGVVFSVNGEVDLTIYQWQGME
jgi:methylated-DNA-protein-cysteine methyltransferase-like protein